MRCDFKYIKLTENKIIQTFEKNNKLNFMFDLTDTKFQTYEHIYSKDETKIFESSVPEFFFRKKTIQISFRDRLFEKIKVI